MQKLFEAIRSGDQGAVTALVEADPSLAVFAAAIQGVDAARLLLNQGADADARSTNAMRNTPLHAAAAGRAARIAKLLLDHASAARPGTHQSAAGHGGLARSPRRQPVEISFDRACALRFGIYRFSRSEVPAGR